MINYAVSLGSFTYFMTDEVADALRKSKFSRVELAFLAYTIDDERSHKSYQLTRDMIKKGEIISSSVHLPFCTWDENISWDVAALDENVRREVVKRMKKIIRDNAAIMAPNATLHGSLEPPQEKHQQHIDQCRRSIEELLPLAQEMGFAINVEYLPRTCIGNTADELQQIVSGFDSEHVGICLDVNHVADKYNELPDIIETLSSRIKTCHICDYDGIDETHWFPTQGIIDWQKVMAKLRNIKHDVTLIYETPYQLYDTGRKRYADPIFALKEMEKCTYILENCDTILPAIQNFEIP
ncbi:MAG: sugar phosphate isomerase/epimerase [Lentisphaeria bacterium]|nr:sugar phosphate isomerase/epimerase [Lentisphaeria bacterium]